MSDKPPISSKLAYTIAEGHRALGIGRTSFYALIKAGELESFKACGRTLIAAESLHAFVDRSRAAASSVVSSIRAPEQEVR